MAINRRTLTALASAVAASLGVLGAASAAQAVTITGSSTTDYTNDPTPTLDFANATPGDIVTINAVSTLPTVYGQVTVDSSGTGSVTVTTPLPTRSQQVVELREYHPSDLVHPVNGDAEYLYTDLVPQLDSGSVHDGDTVDAAAVSFDAQTDGSVFISGWRIALNVSQQGGPATASAQQTVNGSGGVSGLAPAQPLAPGQYTATASTIDTTSERNHVDANLPSDPSNAVSFYVAPAQPTVTGMGGQAAHEGESLNQSAPTVTVSGVLAGAQVKLFTNDPQTGQPMLVGLGTAAGAGQLTIQTAGLPDGGVRLWATQTVDENGTPVSSDGSSDLHSPTSTPSSTFDVDVDTAAPALSGGLTDGAVTNQARPWFRVNDGPGGGPAAGPGAEFVIRAHGATVVDSGPVSTDEYGTATWVPSADLPEGTYTASVVTVDDSGNVNSGAPSNSITFAVDTTAPNAPTVLSPADGATVSTSQPTITVSAEPGSQVTLAVDADQYQQTADAGGIATFTPNGSLSDGQHFIATLATDSAGNQGSTTLTTFTVSTAGGTTPQPPVQQPPAQQPPAQQPPVQQLPTQQPPTHPQTPAISGPPVLSSHTLTAAHPLKVAVKLTAPGTVTLQLTAKVRGKTKVIGTVTVKAPTGTASTSSPGTSRGIRSPRARTRSHSRPPAAGARRPH